MKKNILKFASLFLFSAFVFTSCEEETVTFDNHNGQSIAGFRLAQQELPVNEDGESSIMVTVDVSTVSNVDRAIVIDVDDELSTALPEGYSIDQSTLVVPAGEYSAQVKINGNFNNLADGDATIVLDLVSVDGAEIDELNKPSTTITIYKVCPITESLAGTHSYVTYNVSLGDGEGGATNYPDFSTSGEVTWTDATPANPLTGVYKTTDLTFGLFPAANTPAPNSNTNAPTARLNWICKGIKPSGTDQYGDSYTYEIQSVTGSVMTIHWYNTYMDGGYVDLIREDGENWPDIMQTN